MDFRQERNLIAETAAGRSCRTDPLQLMRQVRKDVTIMNELQVFKNSEFGELGVLEIEGKAYFPATACAKKLGHENPARAVRKYCRGVTELVTPSNGGNQTMRFIPEGDLYRLIVSSKLPAAEKFERWVFDEVLPTIRKHGAYAPDMTSLIKQIVVETVTEVIKQIVPAIITVVRETVAQLPSPTAEVASRAAINIDCSSSNRCKLETFPEAITDQVDSMLEDMQKQQSLNYSMIARFCTVNGYTITSPAVKRYYDRHFA